VSNAADQAIAFARAQIGKPYVFGATGPNSYDCSGLIQAAYKSAGISLPRTTYQQVFSGQGVSKSELAPGDLVFPDPGHVQIYSGNGSIIESPHSGATVQERAMWGFWQARRVTAPGTGVTLASTQLAADDSLAGVKLALTSADNVSGFLNNSARWRQTFIFLGGAGAVAFGIYKLSMKGL
jgi:uncharacterized protein YycO